MKEKSQDFMVGIVNSDPLIGGTEKLLIITTILLVAVGIIWWVKRK